MYKFKVTPEQSKRLQKILFDLGYKWASGIKEITNLDNGYLYLDNGHLSFGETQTYFDNLPHKEVDVSWLTPEPQIKAGGYDVQFNPDGSIVVGCQSIDFETIEAIYNRAKEVMK